MNSTTSPYGPRENLPTEWQLIPFPDAVSKNRFRVGKVKQSDYRPTGKYPIIDQGKSVVAGYWDNESDVYNGALPVVVFGDHTRVFKFVDVPFVCGADGTKVLIPNTERFDPHYLFYALQGIKLPSRGYNRHYKLLQEHSIPSPPLVEQRQIADVLYSVDRAREASEKTAQLVGELKRSIRQYVFRYGPTQVAQAEDVGLQEAQIGQIPEKWKIVRFLDVLSEPLKNGHSAREVSSGPGVRTLTLSAVTNDDFSLTNIKVTSADPARVKDLWLRKDDILIERANTRELVGTAALYRGPEGFAIYPDLVIRARVAQHTIKSKFVVEFLRTTVARRHFQSNARGAAGNMPKIGHGIIKEMRLPLPPLNEQGEIENILQALDDKYGCEKARAAALKQLFASLVTELTTGRRRVGLLESANA